MDVIDLPLEQIMPYARNPRRNEQAMAAVAASIAEFGWRQPIVVDEHMIVLASHTRLLAAATRAPDCTGACGQGADGRPGARLLDHR